MVPPAERKLWRRLSGRQVSGCKFSRQGPVGPYFADFLCRERGLVVEVDGYSHDLLVQADARRDAFMAQAWFHVLRFGNEHVERRLEGVMLTIGAALAAQAEAHPRPLPRVPTEVILSWVPHAGGER